jgi:Cdc6-like AAA superfamily ATPase
LPRENNPFKPTSPVFTGVFAGRLDEIARIEQILAETKSDNPTNLLIVGERGIGKTSLLLLTRALAALDGHDYLRVNVGIGKKTTAAELARSMSRELQRELNASEPALATLKKLWSFVQRLEVGGTRLRETHNCTADCFQELIYSISDTVKMVSADPGFHSPKDGLILFIDEVDSASKELDLGTLLKSLSEKLVAEGCSRLLLVMAGLPETREVLMQSHPSSVRLFEEMVLAPLEHEDVKGVIRAGLRVANEKNQRPVAVDDEALEAIAHRSEGYPHFVQQFGYSAYARDTDYIISLEDVNSSSMDALRNIGNRYYHDMFYNQISNEDYRSILRIMAELGHRWIRKSEIRAQFAGKSSTLNNAITALANRHIILRRPGVQGEYKLQWLGFGLWIRYCASTPT